MAATPPAGRTPSRRHFLSRAGAALSAAVAAFLGTILGAFAWPRQGPRTASWTPLGPTARVPFDSFRAFDVRVSKRQGWFDHTEARTVYAGRFDGAWVVFSATCTHLGCAVRWDRRRAEFRCPCHGGVFGVDGSVSAGPPPQPLVRLPVRERGATLEVEV